MPEEVMVLQIDRRSPKEELGDLFGIFFEDINHAADGGLYAEMVQNRSFEFAPTDRAEYHALYAWEKAETGGAEAVLSVEEEEPFCRKNPHYLVMKADMRTEGAQRANDVRQAGIVRARAGIKNLGFNSGFALKEGETYLFACYARNRSDTPAELTVALEDRCLDVSYGCLTVSVGGCGWTKYEGSLTASATVNDAVLTLTLVQNACIELDFVSLFPAHTFCGRRNGMREDIARLLADMKPKFMRFPGGCLVHDGSLNPDDRDSMYRWKNTIGPVECRPARRSNWGYNQTLGLGYFEYFQFCEDIGAKPLPVLPGGYDPHHQRIVPLDELQPWIDDALDLIEFANGGPDTQWGAKRAGMGHQKPFGLEYLAIGNEEVGEPFFERYPYFHRAIKERYPEIRLINSASPFAAGTEYRRGWKSAAENHSDLIDEHYYMAPEWFLANHHRYDSFSPEGPRVFLGEYASWGSTWHNALVEASYMIGLERNAKAVGLACYAPMLANADYVNWRPDLIWFDNHRVYGTANYYVQKLFMKYQGTRRLEIHAVQGWRKPEQTEKPICGKIRLSGYEAEVRFDAVTVTNDDTGETADFGSYLLKQGDEAELSGTEQWKNYTVRCKARELEGYRGFHLYFGWQDENNYLRWTLGGWQNLDIFVTACVNGKSSDLTEVMFRVEKGRTYDLKLQVKGQWITIWVDDTVCESIEHKQPVVEPLYCAASLDERSGNLIVKAANLQKQPVDAVFAIEGITGTKQAKVIEIKADPEEENSFEHPTRVCPSEAWMTVSGGSIACRLEAESLTVFVISDCV